MEEKYLKFFKLLSIIFGLIFIGFAIMMFKNEIITPEWKNVQNDYKNELVRLNLSVNNDVPVGVRQIEVEDIDHIDRCITCHTNVGEVETDSLTQPFSSHPGSMLEHHDLAIFGCTLCHNGSGRSLRRLESCDPQNKAEWRPLESHCAHCHLAIFDTDLKDTSMSVISEGLDLLNKSGCLGCHKLRGVGGPFGPDLTFEGDKILKSYNFKNIKGEKSLYNWQREHLDNPDHINPGSIMPRFNLESEDLNALVTLILGFTKPTLPLHYYSLNVIREFKNQRDSFSGETSYKLLCSSCHGESGKGRDHKSNILGVPGLANPDFQAVASLDFLSFIVNEGRSDRYMPSWRSRHSGLEDLELSKLIAYSRQWRQDAPSLQQVTSLSPNIAKGKDIYLNYCSTCHGEDRRGGIGPNLSNSSFLSLAADKFLYLTLINGRSNTAMPSWTRFDAPSLANIIRYILPTRNSDKDRSLRSDYTGRIEKGNSIYHYKCSRCHSAYGTGGIGPAILNRDFLNAADDNFIIQTIKQGRSHTPMFKVEQSDTELVDLLVYMRSQKDIIPVYLNPGPSIGNPDLGKDLFTQLCSECHGEEGEGIKAPAINNQEFLNAATNGYLIATMTLGRAETPMPAWGRPDGQRHVLTMRERQHIVTFIRQWQTITIRRQPDDPIFEILK